MWQMKVSPFYWKFHEIFTSKILKSKLFLSLISSSSEIHKGGSANYPPCHRKFWKIPLSGEAMFEVSDAW